MHRSAALASLNRVPVRLTVLFCLGVSAALLGVSVGTTAQSPVATAGAYGISVIVPGQAGASAAGAQAPGPVPSAVADSFVYPADGSIVRTGALSSSVSARVETAPAAQAVTDVLTGSLFNGEITFESVAGRAKSNSAGTDAGGSAVAGLTVLGQPLEATPNQRHAIADWGTLVTLEEIVETSQGESGDARASVTALHITLSAEHAGLPAGTEILIGHADAATSVPAPAVPAEPSITTVPAPGAAPRGDRAPRTRKPKLPKPPEPDTLLPGIRSPIIRPLPTDIHAPLSPNGYVFPVYGPAAFTNTYGAPRAAVTWHHGEDIFAPLGAPILAVADGTVFSVGWNDIGGFRFWLRDRQGNQFYYAHLSAFSPLAVNGNEVRAGQVIGFMGNTGDAQGTPYHLHFEIHPVSLLPMGYDGVVPPYPYLLAWRRLQDVSLAAGRGWAPPVPTNAQAPRPGAFLLGASDISSASGLEPGALHRALVAPASAEGDGALLRSG
jgi:murein DD-endopeptidase MepM/ murein hydrolase activator NlpD